MAELHYPFYDTAQFGTAVATHTLFVTAEGADSAKPSQITNMRIGGQFAQGSQLRIERIGVYVDEEVPEADVPLIWSQCFLKVIIKNKNVLQIPLRMCALNDSYSGVLTQGTAANRSLVGVQGMGFKLVKPIVVPGGEQFKVEVFQITALSGANNGVKVILDGLYDEP